MTVLMYRAMIIAAAGCRMVVGSGLAVLYIAEVRSVCCKTKKYIALRQKKIINKNLACEIYNDKGLLNLMR